jgi:hypothetical protein
MVSLVIKHFSTSSLDGISNMISSIASSIIPLRPLAPVFLSMAFFAIRLKASSSNSRSTPSILNSSLYCFTRAFLGSVRILTNAFSSNSSKVTITGSLPTNSGIKPYFNRSSGCNDFNKLPTFSSSLSLISAPNPIELFPIRF